MLATLLFWAALSALFESDWGVTDGAPLAAAGVAAVACLTHYLMERKTEGARTSLWVMYLLVSVCYTNAGAYRDDMRGSVLSFLLLFVPAHVLTIYGIHVMDDRRPTHEATTAGVSAYVFFCLYHWGLATLWVHTLVMWYDRSHSSTRNLGSWGAPPEAAGWYRWLPAVLSVGLAALLALARLWFMGRWCRRCCCKAPAYDPVVVVNA